MLLDRQRVVAAALHRGIVGHDHHLPPRHAADAGDHRCAIDIALVHPVRGELPDFEERRTRIEQPLHPLAREQLAP